MNLARDSTNTKTDGWNAGESRISPASEPPYLSPNAHKQPKERVVPSKEARIILPDSVIFDFIVLHSN